MTLVVDARASVLGFSVTARFTAGPGVTAIRGPSASGKTLALRLVAGLLRAEAGRVCFGDEVWDAPAEAWTPPERRGIGYAPQHGALWPHRSVRDQLRAISPGRELREPMEALGIGPLLDRFPAGLSGGERQRVVLARALLRRPRLLLLDEPWTALDGDARAVVAEALRRWVREHGAIALLVTHDTEDVRAVADHEVGAAGGVVGLSRDAPNG